MPLLKPLGVIEERVAAIAAYHRDAGIPRAELDLSGGVDSAVMLGLLARALGPDAITCVYTGISSSESSLQRAEETARVFGVPLISLELSEIFTGLVAELRRGMEGAGLDWSAAMSRAAADPTVLGSLRSCLRAPVGRGLNRLAGGGIRHGTGNECEDRWVRFYQKGGDGEVDTNPIAMLSKGEVYQLAVALGVPRSVRVAAPTPDLWGAAVAHTDEAELDAFLGIGAGPLGFAYYGAVDPDSGAWLHAGLIERVSRALDVLGEGLFAAEDPAPWIDAAQTLPVLSGLEADLLGNLLRAARRVERLTRHKLNPNIPALGRRRDLLDAGLITDALEV